MLTYNMLLTSNLEGKLKETLLWVGSTLLVSGSSKKLKQYRWSRVSFSNQFERALLHKLPASLIGHSNFYLLWKKFITSYRCISESSLNVKRIFIKEAQEARRLLCLFVFLNKGKRSYLGKMTMSHPNLNSISKSHPR